MNSVVLLSSGLDSTVNLYQAQKYGKVLLALTFSYSQRAADKETSCAAKICNKLGIPHKILALPFFSGFGKSSLTDLNKAVPRGSQIQIDDPETSKKTAKSVWVPNRNGIFLNIAAGFAESLGAEVVVPGFNIEEAATFPDNSENFLQVLTQSFALSTANHVQAKCFTTSLDKTQIVQLGSELGVDWNLIWPCYHNFDRWCGQCESCQRAKRAFAASRVDIQALFQE